MGEGFLLTERRSSVIVSKPIRPNRPGDNSMREQSARIA